MKTMAGNRLRILWRNTYWFLFLALAILIGLYPVLYGIFGRNFGLLGSKSQQLLASFSWNAAFYIHITGGGLALLTGWSQFSERFRQCRLQLHRNLGKFYVVCALSSAAASIYLGFFANGGLIAALGFISLGLVWFFATLTAYTSIRSGKIVLHEKRMIYSYAACFSAVTLRLWLPLLVIAYHDFLTAYKTVAWMCWLPNLAIAYLLIRKKHYNPGPPETGEAAVIPD